MRVISEHLKGIEAKIRNKEMAYDFLKKVKAYSKNINSEKLNIEKTALIREVYSALNKPDFFEQPVEDYTTFATIQICLDHWKNKNLSENVLNPAIIELEDKVLNTLIKNSTINIPTKETIKEDIEFDKLALKIMIEKYNKKFVDSLTESQQKLIKLYAFDSDAEKLYQEIESVKTKTLSAIKKELLENKKIPQTQKQKFETIKSILEESKIEKTNIDEDTVVFYMSVSKIFDEFNED
jgi:hypothetical protein